MNYITEKNFEEFKKLYEIAVEAKEETFIFEGQVIATHYAKYVIEYFNTKNK